MPKNELRNANEYNVSDSEHRKSIAFLNSFYPHPHEGYLHINRMNMKKQKGGEG
jgi:hypothetical protein